MMTTSSKRIYMPNAMGIKGQESDHVMLEAMKMKEKNLDHDDYLMPAAY